MTDSLFELKYADFPPGWDVLGPAQEQLAETLRRQLDETAIAIIRGLPAADLVSGKRLLRRLAALLGIIQPDVDGSEIQQLVVQDPFSQPNAVGLPANRPYFDMPLHTDGAFCESVPDWVGLLKLDELYASSGDSLFLALDQWDELDRFRGHELAQQPLPWVTPGQTTKSPCWAPIFENTLGRLTIRFSEHCLAPVVFHSLPGVRQFVADIGQSLGNSPGLRQFRLNRCDAYFVNNRRGLHGRCRLNPHRRLLRRVLRVRGSFRSCTSATPVTRREELT